MDITKNLPEGWKVTQTIIIKPEDAGKPITIKAGKDTFRIPTIMAPAPIERPAPWGDGPRPVSDFPKSVIPILEKLNAKNASGGYAVTDAEVLAAKKTMMTHWGMGKYLKPDGSNLKLNAIRTPQGESTSALTPNGFFYGTLFTDAGRELPFFLNIYSEPKFNDTDKAALCGHFESDKKKV